MKINRMVLTAVISSGLTAGAFGLFGNGSILPSAQALEKREDHPKLRAAKDALKDAREELEKSPRDFRGHKIEAMKAIDEAIHQINRCLDIG